jgi:Phosphatidylinositol N-acetylglucosaminyltransferase
LLQSSTVMVVMDPQQKQQQQNKRCLWKAQTTSQHSGKITSDSRSSESPQHQEQPDESFDTIYQMVAARPAHRSFFGLCSNAVVVVQEFALTSFLLARHRIAMLRQHSLPTSRTGDNDPQWPPLHQPPHQQFYWDVSSATIVLALVLAVVYSARADPSSQQQDRPTKIRQRTLDAAVLAVWLRWTAAVLHSLTASYSSDTVEALALAGMLVHLLFCDYSYANGRRGDQLTPTTKLFQTRGARRGNNNHNNNTRPPFKGGTVSLNAALFATTLLVSRLQSGQAAYAFVSLSVVVFAFYPVTRHAISVSYPAATSGTYNNIPW